MTDTLLESRTVDLLKVDIWGDAVALGAAAAVAVAAAIRETLSTQDAVRIVFAAAPSQHETLKALAEEDVEWGRVDAFHMDEYVGLASDSPQRFGNWLRAEFFDRVPLRSVNLIDPDGTAEPQAEAERYSGLVAAAPIDFVLAGIGVNGHLAFNDPPADFDTPETVAVVELDRTSRLQQVEEGLFAQVDDVPTHALTLTVPCLLSAAQLFCMVPGALKRDAVRRALFGEIAPDSPASILRTHRNTRLFLDAEASPYV